MGIQRKLDWRAATHAMRAERANLPMGLLAARSIEAARILTARNVAQRRPLVVNGAFDLSAIMGAAVAQARLDRSRGDKAPWSKLVGFALRYVWRRAKALRTLVPH